MPENNYIEEFRMNNCSSSRLDNRLTFNICGKKYEILESTLKRFPRTLLAKEEKRAEFWDENRGEYYLDRNRDCFKAVLTYYQNEGILYRPECVPEELFNEELVFYGLRQREEEDKPEDKRKEDKPKNKFRRKVWDLFEDPDTSNYAKAIAWFSCTVVLLSIVLFCVETMPQFTKNDDEQMTMDANNPFFVLEATCIAWFTFEYIVRFLSSPLKIKFVTGALNLIDLIAILPFYVSFALHANSNVSSLAILRALRLVRVFRIFKLSRYSTGLRAMGKTMKASLPELGLAAFLLAIAVVLYSSAIYYAEIDENSDFASIPHAFWWSIVTMTTVGYGDIVPVTVGGKIVGSLCACTGIVFLAIPITAIVTNFELYNHNNESNKVPVCDEPKRKHSLQDCQDMSESEVDNLKNWRKHNDGPQSV